MGKKKKRRSENRKAARRKKSGQTSQSGNMAFAASSTQNSASAARANARAHEKGEQALQYQTMDRKSLSTLTQLEVATTITVELGDRATRVNGKASGVQKFQMTKDVAHPTGYGYVRQENKPVGQKGTSERDALAAEVVMYSPLTRV